MKKILYTFVLLLVATVLNADIIDIGAEGEGKAGANLAGQGGVYATGGNAASLAYEKRLSVDMTYRSGLLDIAKTDISIIIPTFYGVVELTGGITDYGEINNKGAEDKVVSLSEMQAILGYGIKTGEMISAGGILGIEKTEIADNINYKIIAGISGMYKKEEVTVSVLINDMIGKTQIKGGIKAGIIIKDNEINGEVDGGLGGEEEMYIAFGGEYSWKKIIALRCGYRIEKNSVNGIYTGAGIIFNLSGLKAKIDYAISPKIFFENDMDLTHTGSLRILF